jgi:hypothetical protein
MESLELPRSGEINWLKFLQEELGKDAGPDKSSQRQVLLENPKFLQSVLIACLSLTGERGFTEGLEIARVIDLEYLESIAKGSELAFRLLESCGGCNCLEVSIHGRS